MSRADCKMCGQPLVDRKAVDQVRAFGQSKRTLTDGQRRSLRAQLVNREVALRKSKPAKPISQIAESAGCSRRTVYRELEWLQTDGTLDAAFKREGLAK